ncbi:interleukin-12 receptor subunit beta-2 [Thunnus maccoyii]|uniref:interleukin-12 receptor subunit beta-2 n=1 Tax=Thunnus maccoyii TaxID=8240 RepID=UPI001C4B195C|nr:interleukin-12 receptor subunit beta-2 [Thunnus maccoyii]
MMFCLDFPLYLMESLKRWSSIYGYVAVFMFLTTVSKGSTCEAPSSPQCFRRNADESVYMCEWSMNMTESDVTFDLYFNETKFNIKKTWHEIPEEQLIKHRLVHIRVEAHVGNSSCRSLKTSVKLVDTVKYEAPGNISVSWLKNNLSLVWRAAEKYPALAEVWFRRDKHPIESWEKRKMTTTISQTSMCQVIVANLLNHKAYQVQIRHQPTLARALNPLWSDWSQVVIVPGELEHKPEVTMTKTLVNNGRRVTLTWKPVQHAAAVRGVTYSLNDTQSSHGCPCRPVKNRDPISTTSYTTYVSYSAVNISVIARNAAGSSPPAIIQVPAESAADLKTCDKTLLNVKINKTTCLEWYEFQDGDPRPENILTLSGRKKKKEKMQIRKNIKDYVRYLYFEHRCIRGKPRTVKMCLFYQKEGVPRREPQDLTAFSETHSSVNLLWKAIPFVDQQGFLTHYRLCSVKIGSQDKQKECHNISASLTKYCLENLTPGTRYDVTLAGVTRAGEGLQANVTIKTLPEKPVNVWLSLGLLFVFFLMSIMFTFILKRIKNLMFPPVPTPVILDFTNHQPQNQETMEKEEKVHELTLHQLPPEHKTLLEDLEESTVQERDDSTDEDPENERGDSQMSEGTSDECLSPGSTEQVLRCSREDIEQMDELTMLIYRKGLVFDVKTDSPENGLN